MSEKIRLTRFKPKANLLYAIGEDLIKDEMAGVMELVKNAHDADAETCEIIFFKKENVVNSISIKDDGEGMTSDEIIKKWMVPATQSKKIKKYTKSGRRVLGSKGIGRFSAMRLGSQIKIVTSSIESNETSEFFIDWEKYMENDLYLDDESLNIEISVISNEQSIHYTQITIFELKDDWGKERIDSLKKELELMASSEEGTDFKLVVKEIEDEKIVSEIVTLRPDAEAPDYNVHARISKEGRASIEYTRYTNTDICPENVKKLIELQNVLNLNNKEKGKENFICGEFEIKMSIWDSDKELIEKKSANLGMAPERVRKFLHERKGFSIIRDGYGVRPYNDPEYDWLNLDKRRIDNPGMRIDSRKVRGKVYITSDKNWSLEDKSSREGLKENREYVQLKETVLAVLKTVEDERYRYRKICETRKNDGKDPQKQRKDAIEEIRRLLKDVEDEALRTEIKTKLDSAERFIEVEGEALESQKVSMHIAYGFGIMATYIVHEESNLSSIINSAANNINRTIMGAKSCGSVQIVGEKLGELERNLASLKTTNEKLMEIRKTLLAASGRKQKKNISIKKMVNQILDIFSADVKSKNIRFEINTRFDKILGYESDIFTTLFNVVGNSVYWVQTRPLPRLIMVESHEDEEYGYITISDNGPGVPAEDAEYIFDLNYTKKQDGMGIGLFLAKEAMRRTNGDIELKQSETGAVFQLKMLK